MRRTQLLLLPLDQRVVVIVGALAATQSLVTAAAAAAADPLLGWCPILVAHYSCKAYNLIRPPPQPNSPEPKVFCQRWDLFCLLLCR